MSFEHEEGLLEQWGLWSRGESCLPKALGAGSEQPEKWTISDDVAMAVDAKIRVLPAHHCRIIKRFYLVGDYDMAADVLDAAVASFAAKWRGRAANDAEEEFCNVSPIRPAKPAVSVMDRRIAEARKTTQLFRRLRQNRPVIHLRATTG